MSVISVFPPIKLQLDLTRTETSKPFYRKKKKFQAEIKHLLRLWIASCRSATVAYKNKTLKKKKKGKELKKPKRRKNIHTESLSSRPPFTSSLPLRVTTATFILEEEEEDRDG